MTDYEQDLDIAAELSQIPAEYQDAFRQAMTEELAETEQDRTDNDILAYLRRRRDDFKRGGFIRPDGRSGLVSLDAATMYEQALPELARRSLGEAEDPAGRRRTLLKLAGFALIVLVFLVLVFRSRANRAAETTEADSDSGTPAATTAAGAPAPTPSLPAVAGAEDSLQTIGGLGGALTIGRPSALELHYARTEETIALAIDPSKTTPKGELRFNEAVMGSDNPVAVWLFGTVLNYAVGIPEGMARNLAPGDRVVLRTDTGAALHFRVWEVRQANNYDATRLLSQNRLGLTLFALPAPAADAVTVALAGHDVTADTAGPRTYAVGERVSLSGGGDLAVGETRIGHTEVGDLRIVVSGTHTATTTALTPTLTTADAAFFLSLSSGAEQTTAAPLAAEGEGTWAAEFVLPGRVTGRQLLAVVRAATGGEPAVVALGEVPDLAAGVVVTASGAWRREGVGEMDGDVAVAAFTLHNPAAGAVYLDETFIQFPRDDDEDDSEKGGDAYEGEGQVVPRLPLMLAPGETVGVTITMPLNDAPRRVQLGAGLWEAAESAAAPPGR